MVNERLKLIALQSYSFRALTHFFEVIMFERIIIVKLIIIIIKTSLKKVKNIQLYSNDDWLTYG